MAPHSSTLAWKIPWTESLVGCSPWGREESDFPFTFHFHALEKEMATHSSVLAWGIPGTGALVLRSGPPAFLTQGWGSTYQAWQQPTQQVPSK